MGKIVTSRALQEALEITSYDVYQYLRRGLPQAEAYPGMYDLQEASEWIRGFARREEKRERIKQDLLNQLTEEEAEIINAPKWDAQYAVVWGMTSKRQALAIQRAIYLMVQYSTSRGDNLVYLSATTQQAREIQAIIDEHLGELARGFRALNIQEIVREIAPEASLEEVIRLLENNPALQEQYGLIYRTWIVEEFERFTAEERRLFELLTTHYGEYMVNVDKQAVEQRPALAGWMTSLEKKIGAGNYFLIK